MTLTDTPPPKVFISYSHDDERHKDRVLKLADDLRDDGIEAEIDQYIDAPPEGWPLWCQQRIGEADFVLLVCTEIYQRRVSNKEEPGVGRGVLWEAQIIRQMLYDSGAVNAKFIPVLFSDGSPDHIPVPIKGATRYFVDRDDGYEDLCRQLTKQPRVTKPLLGKRKALPPKERKPEALAAAQSAKQATAPTEYDAFIIYSRQDDTYVTEVEMYLGGLRNALARKSIDFEYFVDKCIRTADDWDAGRIEPALRSAYLFIIISTPRLYSRDYVAHKEIPAALEATKDVKRQAKVFTLLFEGNKSQIRRFGLDQFQYRDLRQLDERNDLCDMIFFEEMFDLIESRKAPLQSGETDTSLSEGRDGKPSVRAKPGVRVPDHIQVIGWRGIEPKVIYHNCAFRDSLAFLTTEMSFNTLPLLQFCRYADEMPAEFNVIYMDVEFIERYNDLGLIQNFVDNEVIMDICDPGGLLDPAIRRLVFPDPRRGMSSVGCVPIQFGFNEVLVNERGDLGDAIRKKLEGENTVWSYSDFHLETLFKDRRTKIAIWHWYLPSLSHLLLTVWARQANDAQRNGPDFSEAKADVDTAKLTSLVTRLKELASWRHQGCCKNVDMASLERHISVVCDLMQKDVGYRDRVMVCKSLRDVRNAINGDFRAGVLLGIGSSVLSGADYGHVQAIVPKEGVPMWINCAAALRRTISLDVSAAAEVIRYWVEDETQRTLFVANKDYIGLPVNRNILLELQEAHHLRTCHALQTFNTLYDRFTGSERALSMGKFTSGMVATRVVPRFVWSQWVGWWESFLKASE